MEQQCKLCDGAGEIEARMVGGNLECPACLAAEIERLRARVAELEGALESAADTLRVVGLCGAADCAEEVAWKARP